jgi:hypothetical protein
MSAASEVPDVSEPALSLVKTLSVPVAGVVAEQKVRSWGTVLASRGHCTLTGEVVVIGHYFPTML